MQNYKKKHLPLRNKIDAMAISSICIPFFGTFIPNKILDKVLKFQSKTSSCYL